MKITFLGATKTVTGSNFLVEAAGKRFLVDCGMWQGNAEHMHILTTQEEFQNYIMKDLEIKYMHIKQHVIYVL